MAIMSFGLPVVSLWPNARGSCSESCLPTRLDSELRACRIPETKARACTRLPFVLVIAAGLKGRQPSRSEFLTSSIYRPRFAAEGRDLTTDDAAQQGHPVPFLAAAPGRGVRKRAQCATGCPPTLADARGDTTTAGRRLCPRRPARARLGYETDRASAGLRPACRPTARRTPGAKSLLLRPREAADAAGVPSYGATDARPPKSLLLQPRERRSAEGVPSYGTTDARREESGMFECDTPRLPGMVLINRARCGFGSSCAGNSRYRRARRRPTTRYRRAVTGDLHVRAWRCCWWGVLQSKAGTVTASPWRGASGSRVLGLRLGGLPVTYKDFGRLVGDYEDDETVGDGDDVGSAESRASRDGAEVDVESGIGQ